MKHANMNLFNEQILEIDGKVFTEEFGYIPKYLTEWTSYDLKDPQYAYKLGVSELWLKIANIKYNQKKAVVNQQQRNGEIDHGFKLPREIYFLLMIKAGISPMDLGRERDDYCLARKNQFTGELDQGDYAWGNCRFVTVAQNAKERWTAKQNNTAVELFAQ
jgi:hypothetical protein